MLPPVISLLQIEISSGSFIAARINENIYNTGKIACSQFTVCRVKCLWT